MNNTENGRSLATIVSEIKEELKQFIQTRVEMLKQEIQEKLARLKIAGPLAAVAILFLGTAYLLITLSLVPALTASRFRQSFPRLQLELLDTSFGHRPYHPQRREGPQMRL